MYLCTNWNSADSQERKRHQKLETVIWFLEMICCVTFIKATEREPEGEDKVMNDRAEFFNFIFGMMFQ